MVGEVRGSHFMMGIEFVRNKATREAFADEDNVGYRIAEAIKKRGLIGRSLGNIMIFSPTLILDEAMIMDIEGILREGISEVAAELGL